MDRETEAQMPRKSSNFHKVTPFTEGQVAAQPLPGQVCLLCASVSSWRCRSPAADPPTAQPGLAFHFWLLLGPTHQKNKVLVIEKADDLKKWLGSCVCFLDFEAFQVLGLNSWVLGGASRLWFTAKSWVCLAQRSDLRVI